MNMSGSSFQNWFDDPSLHRLFSNQLRATGHILRSQIQQQHLPRGLARLLHRVLRVPGRLLSRPVMQGNLLEPDDLRGWPLPVLLMAASASRSPALPELPALFWRRVCAVAAAAEFLGAATDIIDDIQDGDSALVEQLGTAQSLTVGLALLELVPLTLERAHVAGWMDQLAHAALIQTHQYLLSSLGGQYLDLHFETLPTATETQVMEMTEKKSGSLLALLYRLGVMAGITTAHQFSTQYLEAADLLGRHIGIWQQLLNDLHAAKRMSTTKSDRHRRKKTLPLVLEQHDMIGKEDTPAERFVQFHAAIAYTYTTAETARLRAQRALQALEAQFDPHPLLWPILQASQSAIARQEDESQR